MVNKSKRIISFIVSMVMLLSVPVPSVMAEETEYASREYVVSEFVQSVGRSNLEKSDAVLEIFDDSDEISPQYKDDVSRAIVGGIIKGYDDHTIKPQEKVRRIEAMLMLARCAPSLPATEEPVQFTDVPSWAEEEISYLSSAGLLKGYGDGTMGADDFITVEQVAILVQRSDDALRTVEPGDSFYGYINEKQFRNVVSRETTVIDPLHGAVVTMDNSWSHFSDVYEEILAEENEILQKLMDGEISFEKGSTEQRIYDMLECIDADIAVSESDKKNISDMRSAIMNATSIEELLDVARDIYLLAGINVLFDVGIDLDKETGVAYPSFSIAASGDGGFLKYRESTDTEEYREIYSKLLSDYFEEIGADFTQEDIDAAIKLQVDSSYDVDYFSTILTYLVFAQAFGIIDAETLEKEIQSMIDAHPQLYDEEYDILVSPTILFETRVRERADLSFTGFDLCEELASYGFTNLEKIIVPTGYIEEAEKNLISEENLEALKLNALLKLGTTLDVSLNDEEAAAWSNVGAFQLFVCLYPSAEELAQIYEDTDSEEETEEEIEEDSEEDFEEPEFDEGILSAGNLNRLGRLLPNDIGLLHAKYYYNDEISEIVAQMFYDIWDGYEKRFNENTWMKEETKESAIKKLDNMLAVIAYPDNYTFPEITPVSEGGSLFSNTLSIMRHNTKELIRCNEEKLFIRTQMLMAPDTVNACYIPSLNTINIPEGILNAPFFDENASYAANLGSIGMIIAHEIGHAFDSSGSMYDENGCEKNWWTPEDLEEFQKKQEYFIEYYNQFEVVDGVVQDASITITENMADFAAMQIIMDIIGDDKEAQKECFEAYATMWAQIGSVSFLTQDSSLNDVHAANVVRVNAVVASFNQFYEIYDVQEGDAMYVAPENRLKLW